MDSINYSSVLLEREFDDREPIRRALQHAVERFDLRRKEILELGSGLGFNLDVFRQENNSVTGVEGLDSAATAAAARGVPTIVADLALPVPLADACFDAVLCLDVLEHLANPQLCLAEAHRLLRPDGVLLVNVPNHFTLSGRLNILRGRGIDSVKFFPNHADWENPHLRFFRHTSIKRLLEHSEFRIAEDWSAEFASVPLLNKLKRARGSGLVRALARTAPELFAGGFFLIARKQ